jgi:hypothetical protein
MAKNLGREYAAMTEQERREFELKRAGADREDESAEELDLDDPRRYPRLKDEAGPPPEPGAPGSPQ